jgi:vacuolar-type H+-ATPase subunit H
MSSDTRSNETVKKGLLDWIGYKKDVSTQLPTSPEELLGYIQKLEAEIEDLRSRKDFAQLTEQELEALAAETAVQILTTVHQREEEAKKLAEKVINDAEKQASKILTAATKNAESQEHQSVETVRKAELQAEQTLKTANDSAFSIVQQAESTASKTKSDVENQSRATIQKAEEYAKLLEKEVTQQLGAVRIAHESLLDLLQKSQVANEKAQASVVAAIEVLNQKSAKNIKVEPKS